MTAAREPGSPRAPATAALGLALTLVGLGFGLAAALVCGIGLLVLALGAVAWVELATFRGRLERIPGPGRLEESEPFHLRLVLRRTLLPPPGGELLDPLLDRSVPVGPRWTRRLEREVWLERPGRRRLEPSRLIVRDPLGLWRRQLDSGRSDELVVLPRIDPVRWTGLGAEPRGLSAGSGNAADASSRRGGLAQFEVDGLRPYRDGSPASRIHWPAVARTGEMIERRLVAGGEPRPLVVFDPRGGTAPADRDRAMRAAASLCVELARSGGCELLVPGERRPLPIDPALRAWPEAHVRIAVSDPHTGPMMPAGMTGAAVLWVTAGGALPSSLRRLHPGSFLITPRGSRRAAAAFRVSACFGYPATGAGERSNRLRRAAA
jgi:uncharacterized protein (DUF58 family)